MSTLQLAIVGIGGRMGSEVAEEAADRTDVDTVVGIEHTDSPMVGQTVGPAEVDVTDAPDAVFDDVDVAVDFSTPQGLTDALEAARRHGVAVVSGTTGLDEADRDVVDSAAREIPLLRAANFSVGVNILKELVARGAEATEGEFDPEIFEAHHRNKRDAPSGTALALGEIVAEARGWDLDEVANWSRKGDVGERSDEEIGFQVRRGGGIKGEHTVALCGTDETIELTHRAGSRNIFAAGALRAAEWLEGRPAGQYGMEDVLF